MAANMFYNSPEFAQAGANLAAIFDPRRGMQRDALAAQMEENRAQAEAARAQAEASRGLAAKYGSETTSINAENDAKRRLSDIMTRLIHPSEAATILTKRDTDAYIDPTAQGEFYQAFKNPKEADDAINGSWLRYLSSGSLDERYQAALLSGHPGDPNSSYTPGHANANAARNAGFEQTKQDSINRTTVSANDADNAALIANNVRDNQRFRDTNAADNANKLTTFFNAPIQVAPGYDAYIPVGNPNRASLGDRLHNYTPTSASGGGAIPQVTGPIANQIRMAMLKLIPGAVVDTADKKGKKADDYFDSAFSQEQLAAAAQAGSDAWQGSHGNLATAAKAMYEALGLQPGANYARIGEGWFGQKGNITYPNRPAAAAATVAPAAAAATPAPVLMNASQTARAPTPVSPMTPLPPNVREVDVQKTMKLYQMTRDQVIQRLTAGQ